MISQVAEHPHQRRRAREQRQAGRARRGCGRAPARRRAPRLRARSRVQRAGSGVQPSGTASRAPRTPTPPGAAARRAPAARAPARRARGRRDSTSRAREHEQQVGDVHVRAHAVGEHRHAREQDQRRERPGGPPEPLGAEPVHDPPAAPTAPGSRARRSRLSIARGPERRERPRRAAPPAGGAWARSGPRTAGRLRARELSAPGERVQGVVVGEAHAAEHPQQRRPRATIASGAPRRAAKALESGPHDARTLSASSAGRSGTRRPARKSLTRRDRRSAGRASAPQEAG